MTGSRTLCAADYPLLVAVVLLPWAFGGVETWAYRTAAFLIVIAVAVLVVRHGWSGLGLNRRSAWLLPAVLLGLWAAIQITPLPPGLIRAVSPNADALYRASFPGYGQTPPADLGVGLEGQALDRVPEVADVPVPPGTPGTTRPEFGGRWSGWRTISLFPGAGGERLQWYLALLLGFLVVRQRTADRAVARVYRNVLFANFLSLAIFGLIYAATSNDKLYWIRPSLEQARAFGPYLNPTNFAGVMELATPWLAGCALATWRRSRGDRLTELRAPMLAAVAVLCLTSALATASKGSAVLLVVSLTLLGWVSVRGRGKKLAVLGVAALLCAGAVHTLRSTKLGERVEQFLDLTEGGYAEVGRLVAWRSSLPMLSDYAAVGSGFGSFRDVFPRYVPTGEALRWQQVHNDYLELLIEGGVVAGALLAWLVWAYWSRVLRGTRWRSSEGPHLEALGLVLGLVSLSVHAFFDFNHQIPANALLFVTLAAMAMARSERSPQAAPHVR